MIKFSKFIKNIFFKLGLIDSPNKLKKHANDIPLVGGLLFLLVIIISSQFTNFDNYTNVYLLIAFIMIGIWDDIKDLNPNLKFFVTSTFLIIIISFDTSLQIKSINFLHFKNIFIPYNKYLNILIPTFCLMLLLNAFNMSDGINGLASGIFLSWSLYLIIKFPLLTNVLFPFVISVIFFLYFNLKNQAFLGDGGNYFLSMILGTVVIKINNYDATVISAEEIFLLFLIPGIDMIRLFFIRIRNKKNPFSPDRNHLHHMLLKKYGYNRTILIIISLSILPYLTSVFIGSYIILTTFIILYSFLISFLTYKKTNN